MVDLYPRLIALAGQITELQTALNVHAPRQLASFAQYQEEMALPLLGIQHPLHSSKASPPVDPHVMNWLSIASDLLSDKTTRNVPSPDERETLRQKFEAAGEAIRTDKSVPAELRLHLLALVEQALGALDRVEIVGPDAVMAIADQMILAGAHLPKGATARGPLVEALKNTWTVVEATVVAAEFAQLVSAVVPGLGG